MDRRWKTGLRLAGLAAIFLGGVAAWRGGAMQAASWPALVAHHRIWAVWVAAHPVAAPLAFIGIYALSVALFLPAGLWLSLLGGLLFGVWFGSLLTIIGSGGGAIAAFLLARGLMAPFFESRFQRRVGRMREGLERDGFSYLLAVRLMPVFPFWLVNLAPALLGMRLAPYAAATLLGLIPASFILNAVGAGLAATLASGGRPGAGMLLKPDILLPLLALAILALLPPLWRAWKRSTARVADTA